MRVLSSSDHSWLEASCRVLAEGGTVVHATETCYGIACDLSSSVALQALFAVKRRPDTQPVSALFASIEQVERFLELSSRARDLIETHLPGPLTVVVPRKPEAPTPLFVVPDAEKQPQTVGIRISSHPLAQQLVTSYGKPIATTSANVHGQPNPYTLSDLRTQFSSPPQPDLILDSGVLPQVPPSTVVEVIGETVRVLRQGEIVIF